MRKRTFTIYEPCTKLSLMNDFASEAARVFVLIPMIEEKLIELESLPDQVINI